MALDVATFYMEGFNFSFLAVLLIWYLINCKGYGLFCSCIFICIYSVNMEGKIKQIFNNMDYGKVFENVGLAESWFRNNMSIYERFTKLETEPKDHVDLKNINTGEELATVYTYDLASVNKILESVASCTEWRNLKSIQRAKILNQFAKEIAANADLISQIEICVRGILTRDSKGKSVPLLVDYLEFYSNFAANVGEDSPKGLVVANVATTDNFLGILAFVLGPVLAAGHNLVIHAETRLSVVVFLLIELSIKAGIPKSTIAIIPNSVNISVFLESEHVDFVTVLGKSDEETSAVTSGYNKRHLLFSPKKIPALVFNNADMNSACDSIIKSVWNHEGMLPYSVRNVFVQEDILSTFLRILKEHLKKFKLSTSNEKIADITYPSGRNILLLKQAVQKAKLDGIEIYQPECSSGNYLPTIFIGCAPDTETDAPFAVVSSFRTINEAVTLANNNKQGFGAIIWTENVSLANEVARKLKVSNVWVNTEGVLKPSIPSSGFKESGKGYFGGKEGLDEYLVTWKPEKKASKELDFSTPTEDMKILNVITASKKAQESWGKLNLKDRIQRLKTVAESNCESFSALDDLIYQAIYHVSSPVLSDVQMNYDIKISTEPLGVLVIKTEDDSANNLLVAAILFGNSVIFLTENSQQKKKYECLLKTFTASGVLQNVLTVMEYTENTIKLLQVHKEVKRIFINDYFPNVVPLKNIPKNYPVVTDWFHVLSNIVYKKTVWTTIGQSFI